MEAKVQEASQFIEAGKANNFRCDGQMTWKYEQRIRMMGKNNDLPVPVDFFVNDDGIEVEIRSARDYWLCVFKHDDLNFSFNACPRGLNKDIELTAKDLRLREFQLGPWCSIYLSQKDMSREISESEKALLTRRLADMFFNIHILYPSIGVFRSANPGWKFNPIKKISWNGVFQGESVNCDMKG